MIFPRNFVKGIKVRQKWIQISLDQKFLLCQGKEVVVPITSFEGMWKIFILHLHLSTDSKLRLRVQHLCMLSVVQYPSFTFELYHKICLA